MIKPTYIYPGSDFDRVKTLISLLGTFWSRTYAASDQMQSYAIATGYTVSQTYKNLLETARAYSRYDIPLFHEETIFPITLKKSTLNSASTNTVKFDSTAAKFTGELNFDRPVAGNLFSFPLPKNFKYAAKLFDRVTYPVAALDWNTDFTVDETRNALVFIDNPFENTAFARRQVVTEDGPDEEITLWAFCAAYDYEYVFNQFAYALGIRLKTSQNYKDFINAIFSGLIDGGLTAQNLDLAFAALCGVPVAAAAQETVEVVEYDAHGLLIVTDKAVYKFPETATPTVQPGQVILGGAQLVRGFEIDEFFVASPGTTNDADAVARPDTTSLLVSNVYENITTEYTGHDILVSETPACPVPQKPLAALALDNNFLSTCFYGDLVFENKDVPLEVNTKHTSGYTYVKFALNGYPADAQRFFDELHARGVALAETTQKLCFDNPIVYDEFSDFPALGTSGKIYYAKTIEKFYEWRPELPDSGLPAAYEEIIRLPPNKKIGTLAHILDTRANPTGEPTQKNLPTKINPLRFIVENVLRNNVFVVRINVNALGQNRLGLYNIRHLRQVLPPQTAMIVVFELAPSRDKINAEDYVRDTATYFKGAEPQKDTIDENYVKDLGVTITNLSGTCQ